ncbi:MAG: NAD(P)-dependent oxidoreductase [Pseudomonadota bacterium]
MKNPVIALLGTGLMGAPMARNILKAGFELKVWNRSTAKAQPLADDGAVVCTSPEQAIQAADLIITMVTDGAIIEDLIFSSDLFLKIKPGACLIDMSSIKPVEAKSHASRLGVHGVDHLDAPVSGGTKGAEAGTLAIMAGGTQSVFDLAKPLLETMGRPVLVGPSGAGQLSKLANQLIVGVTIGVVAEAMLLAEQGGADPAAIRDALKGGFADSTILQQHGERMTTGNFEPGGLSHIQLKDLNNGLEEAANFNLTLPLAMQARDRYARLCAELECADKDHSGLYIELKEINGL